MTKNNNMFGEFFKKMRFKTGLTLREFCRQNGLDASNLSKIERGMAPPPKSREKLERYAACLKLEENSDDWYDFFDYAAACSGSLPTYITSDEEIARKLPLVFRTVRSKRISEQQLDNLIELIRRT